MRLIEAYRSKRIYSRASPGVSPTPLRAVHATSGPGVAMLVARRRCTHRKSFVASSRLVARRVAAVKR